MSLPTDTPLVTLTYGSHTNSAKKPLIAGTMYVMPMMERTHIETGSYIDRSAVVVDLAGGTAVSDPVVASDAPGFNVTGNVAYAIKFQGLVAADGTTIERPAILNVVLPGSVPVVDVDELTSGTSESGIIVNFPSVIEVAGYSGSVTVDDLMAALDLSLAAKIGAVAAQVIGVPAPTGVAATDTASLTAAFNQAVTVGKAIVELRPGTYVVNAALPVISKVGISIRGAGSAATKIVYTGTGPALKFLPAVFDVHQAGSVTGLTIDGSTNTNPDSGGIYYADIIGFSLADVVVDYFTGDNQYGIFADTVGYWTERQTWMRVHVNNCTHGVRFGAHAPVDTSHGWSRFLDVRVNVSARPVGGFAQTGVMVDHAFVYNSTMFITVNVAGTTVTDTLAPTVMRLKSGGKIKWGSGAIYAEISNGVNANGLVIDSDAGMVFDGILEIPWAGNAPTTSTDIGLTGQIRLPGMIPTTGLSSGGLTVVSPVGGTSQDRVLARPNGSSGTMFVESLRPDNKTLLEYAKEGATTKNLRETIFDATTTQVIERADRWSAPGSITRASLLQPLLPGPNQSAVWGAANRAIFARLDVPVRGTYRYIRFAMGVSSGNIQVGLVRLTGALATYDMVLDSGVIAAPAAGAKRIDLGATHLASGHYAIFFWANNTTVTAPWQGLNANEGLGHAVVDSLASGVPATGTVSSWQSNARLGAFALEADV